MSRRRFFIPRDRIRNGAAVLTEDQSHHLRDVLRLRVGDEVELFDGEGFGYSGIVESRGPEARIGSLKALQSIGTPKTALVLAAALIKSERFEWMLQKGTELGVHRFLPLATQFSGVRIPNAKQGGRLERWQRIVREAAKQCGRLTIPEIQAPVSLDALLDSPAYAAYARFMLYEKAPKRLQRTLAIDAPVLLCVGPEGGWDVAEAQAAEHAGFQLVSLGSRVLRAETAAIAAVAIFLFLLE